MGGNSTKATSGINGSGTQTQQDSGITDSAKIFFEDTKKSVRIIVLRASMSLSSRVLQARELARDDLIRVLTGRSADAVQWLQDKFKLDLSKVARLGGHSQPRTHRGDAQFPGMVSLVPPLSNIRGYCARAQAGGRHFDLRCLGHPSCLTGSNIRTSG